MDKKTLGKLVEKKDRFMSYETKKKITWCSGCGDFAIQNALTRALVLEDFERNDFVMCFDIGCNGNSSDLYEANTIHGLHGRVTALAAGCALANSKMKIIASAGDGATFSEGVNHLVHAVRNDYPMMFIHHNNENYGLTVGQASACTHRGAKMSGTPGTVTTDPINTLEFVLSLDPSFVARCYSGEVDHMTEVFRRALKHKGFAFVEVLQSCPTYNKLTPDEWYASRVRFVENLKDYDAADIWQARKLVSDMNEEFYLGVLYENPAKLNFLDAYPFRKGVETTLVEEVRHYDVGEFL